MTDSLSPPSRLAQALGLVAWLSLVFAAAALGAVASMDVGPFYESLGKPAWAPPAALFAPVWREQAGRDLTAALILFVLQLAVNAAWSWLFFAWRQGKYAFICVLLLWVLVLLTTVTFHRIRRLAAALMLPYLAWVAFAAALTWAVWQANPDVF